MNKHTPGPWLNQGQWNTDRGVAECIEAQGWGIIGAWIDKSNEGYANARLIAAAPELLAACMGVIHHNDGLKDAYKISPSLIHQVEAAIAKATGGA